MLSTVIVSLEALGLSHQILRALLAYLTNLPDTLPNTYKEPPSLAYNKSYSA